MIGALLIGVQTYGKANQPGSVLPGTLENVERFARWLKEHRGVVDADIIRCVTAPNAGAGPTRRDVIDAVKLAVAQFRGQATELFVYFAGHGFSYRPDRYARPVDVLVASDFTSLEEAADATVPLPELTAALASAIGPGDHYYFIEACREEVDASKLSSVRLGWNPEPSSLGRANVYCLYAARPGARQQVGDDFSVALNDGLCGRGRAKKRDRAGNYVVSFEQLFLYLQERLGKTRVDRDVSGDGLGLLTTLPGRPTSRCELVVEPAGPDDRFTAFFYLDMEKYGDPLEFDGARAARDCKPDDYLVRVRAQDRVVRMVEPEAEPVDLWDDRVLRFVSEPTDGTRTLSFSGGDGPRVRVRVVAPEDASLTVAGAGVQQSSRGTFEGALPLGDYTLTLQRAGGPPRYLPLRVEYGRLIELDCTAELMEPAHAAIAALCHGRDPNAPLNISEQLGELPDRELALWLCLVGGALVCAPGSKHMDAPTLSALALERLPVTDRGLLVLCTLPELERVELRGGVSLPARPLPEAPGLRFAALASASAPAHDLARLVFSDQILALPLLRLPGRVTLLVLTRAPTGALAIRVMLLPGLPEQQRLEADSLGMRAPMRVVLASARAQRQILDRKPVNDALQQEERGMWQDQLYGKWVDPTLALAALYELVRRGGGDQPWLLDQAIQNLRRFFPEIPDTEAIAGLRAGAPVRMTDPPLLQEGWIAAGRPTPPELDGFALDWASRWTLWRRSLA